MNQRREKILDLIQDGKASNIEDIAKALKVSKATVAVDLRVLRQEKPGLINIKGIGYRISEEIEKEKMEKELVPG